MQSKTQALKIGIDARLETGIAGGVEQALIGLANGLSQLQDGNEEYHYLVLKGHAQWLGPYLGSNSHLLEVEATPSSISWKQKLKRLLPFPQTVANLAARFLGKRMIKIPQSNGMIERAGMDVMHFPTQAGFQTSIPSLYQPWDLQHRHYPEFFSYHQRLARDIHYCFFCEQAKVVSVASQWIKNDVVKAYNLSPEKVCVIPMAAPIAAYPLLTEAHLASARKVYLLPDRFIIYPAQTFRHKNHLALIEAIALLRDKHGLRVPLVLTGRCNEYFPTLQARMDSLNLSNQIQALGFMSVSEYQALLNLSTALVFPSKFEGWGLPITEAMLAGVPIACSNVTSLPEQVGDAALIFDPDKPEEIAEAIRRLWTDDALRATLIARGKQQVTKYSWSTTARMFRAHYRQIAGRTLNEEDRTLLQK